MNNNSAIPIIKKRLIVFIIVLFLSGLSAIPIEEGLRFVLRFTPSESVGGQWFLKVLTGVQEVKQNAPFLLYGYDWLAFAHFVIAILFIGPYRNPVRNIWVIEFGLIACALIIPFALTAGYFRDIPFWWRLVDCSFGIFGFILLWSCYSRITVKHYVHSKQNIFA